MATTSSKPRLATAALLLCLACGSKPPPEPSAKPRLVPMDVAPAVVQDVPSRDGLPQAAPSGEPVKVGILHSLSGTLAQYETPLKDMALMTIDELNAEGGVLGRPIAPIVVDPASNWPLFAEKARDLLQKDGAQALFGGYTSVSRKSMLPVLEELNGLLFYPAEYEGEKPSQNVAYAGAVPNQSVGIVVDYLLQAAGAKPKRWMVLGTDYVLPRTQSKVITEQLIAHGVKPDDVVSVFVPFGHQDFVATVAGLQKLGRGQPMVVISLLFEDAANSFQAELLRQRVSRRTVQIVSFGIDERQLTEQKALFRDTLVASSYFSVLDNPVNAAFSRRWASYLQSHEGSAQGAVLNDELEATYLELRLWKKAAEAAKSVDPPLVARALGNQSVDAPSGFTVTMDAASHHLRKPYFVGRVDADGRVSVIFQTPSAVPADARYY
jgi:urea transport system substrate-binding protein